VLLIGGGNTFYLSYWMQKSGVFDVLPEWLDSKIYVGISVGSQIAGANLQLTSEAINKSEGLRDNDFDELGPVGESSAKTLKLVNFIFRPHLNSPIFPKIREEFLRNRAKDLDVPLYAVDDQTALKVVDGKIDVVSEGNWLLFDK
jgi:dipeptidase E